MKANKLLFIAVAAITFVLAGCASVPIDGNHEITRTQALATADTIYLQGKFKHAVLARTKELLHKSNYNWASILQCEYAACNNGSNTAVFLQMAGILADAPAEVAGFDTVLQKAIAHRNSSDLFIAAFARFANQELDLDEFNEAVAPCMAKTT